MLTYILWNATVPATQPVYGTYETDWEDLIDTANPTLTTYEDDWEAAIAATQDPDWDDLILAHSKAIEPATSYETDWDAALLGYSSAIEPEPEPETRLLTRDHDYLALCQETMDPALYAELESHYEPEPEPVTEPEPETAIREALEAMAMPKLRALAKELKLVRYSKLRKADLIAHIMRG